MRLANKIALVTGAARGIGQAIAEEFARQGATVIVTDVDEQAGQQVASDIGGSAQFLPLDVGSEAAWAAVSDRVRNDFGTLDILVNNAGITGFMSHPGPFDPEHFNLDSWHAVHRVNLDGVALGCKYAIGLMKTNKAASIVNISSVPGWWVYRLLQLTHRVKRQCEIILNPSRFTARKKATLFGVIPFIPGPS